MLLILSTLKTAQYIDIGVVDGLIWLSSWQQAARRKHRKIVKQSEKAVIVYR